VLLVVGIFACGGLGWLGMSVFQQQVQDELERNPVVQGHVGLPLEVELDFVGTGAAQGANEFVLRVSGPKGSGKVTIDSPTRPDGSSEFLGGTLVLEDGRRFDLYPEAEASEPE
jgi:hypothetical protein